MASGRQLRAALATTAVAAALLVPASTAWAAGGVVVAPDGGAPVTVSIPELLADPANPEIVEADYVVRGSAGESTVHVRGITLERVLDRVQVDPFGFEGFMLSGGGRDVTLTRDQITDPNAFGGPRPIFYLDEQGTLTFLRPSTGPDDLNGDQVISVPGGDVTIALSKRGALGVQVKASKTRIEAGETVTFTAAVSGAQSGEDVRVDWTLPRGARSGVTRVTYRFKRPGSYKVIVGATSDADENGAYDYVRVQVGEPPEGGPDREGGGTNTAADAPDSGAATGAPGPAAATPLTPVAPTPPAPEPKAPAAPKAPGPAPTVAAEPVLPKEQQEAVQEAVPAGAPEQVEGVLLSDASAVPTPAAADAVRAARTGTPKDDAAPAGVFATVPPAAVGTLGVLALLGLGAWWERRGLPRRSD